MFESDWERFIAKVLNESETLDLLRLSMSPVIAEHLWKRMLAFEPSNFTQTVDKYSNALRSGGKK